MIAVFEIYTMIWLPEKFLYFEGCYIIRLIGEKKNYMIKFQFIHTCRQSVKKQGKPHHFDFYLF